MIISLVLEGLDSCAQEGDESASVEYSAALSLVAENACAEMVDGRRPLNSLVAEMSVRFFGMVVPLR